MARRWWKWALALGVILLLVWGFDRAQDQIEWIGSTDLEMEFAVTDADSGSPIPGARVEIHSDEERDKFVLVADAAGVARKGCPGSRCCGTRSGLGFTKTYVVHPPWWRFRVCASGHVASEWVNLDVAEYIRQVQRSGPGRAKLVVQVPLRP